MGGDDVVRLWIGHQWWLVVVLIGITVKGDNDRDRGESVGVSMASWEIADNTSHIVSVSWVRELPFRDKTRLKLDTVMTRNIFNVMDYSSRREGIMHSIQFLLHLFPVTVLGSIIVLAYSCLLPSSPLTTYRTSVPCNQSTIIRDVGSSLSFRIISGHYLLII